MKLKHLIALIIFVAVLFYTLGFVAGQYNGQAAFIREAQKRANDAQPLRFPIGAF